MAKKDRILNRRDFLKFSFSGSIGLSAASVFMPKQVAAIPNDPSRPNLLYILADQHRFDAIRRVQNELSQYNNKIKIKTPNLDKLSLRGAYFRNAYSQCPVCGPDRTVLRTGCTVERTGAQTNDLVSEDYYNRMPQFKQKIESLETLDQLLVENYGYISEYYGKWHLPERFYYTRNGTGTVISKNDYDYENDIHLLTTGEAWSKKLKRYLTHFDNKGEISKSFTGVEQQDTYSKYAYTPIRLDVRYGKPANTPLTTAAGYETWQTGQPNVMGKYSFSEEYTPTHYNGEIAIKALDKLAKQSSPFIMTASFHNPHAPMIAAEKYLDYYWKNRDNLFVSPSITETGYNSAYFPEKTLIGAGYDDPEKVKEWIACYYAMIEEIDVYIGKLLDTLESHNITDNTMIVFTSDHGEMLGAHGSREKNKFLEESVHVPLFISYPKAISPKTIIEQPVSHLDLFSTILDYMGFGSVDTSDGTSMRHFIEQTSYNKDFDEEAVVAEWDFRDPNTDGVSLSRTLGKETNFMILKGKDKLMMTKHGTASRVDMMYNLENDPNEMNNLVGNVGMSAQDNVIGKAEHLKCLLIEWMQRMDGDKKYYSDPIYNAGEGLGDIAEIDKRRKWKTLDMWVSDTVLQFGKPVHKNNQYIRNEYLYIGRTNSGTVNISDIIISGADAGKFSLDKQSSTITKNKHVKIRVRYNSTQPSTSDLDAKIIIKHNSGPNKTVLISCSDSKAPVTPVNIRSRVY